MELIIVIAICAAIAPIGLIIFAVGLIADMVADHPRGNIVAFVGLLLFCLSVAGPWIIVDNAADRVVLMIDGGSLTTDTTSFLR
ncbi:hypothetical protein KDD17_09440 [Sulfitobacter albidus]|uniref:Uncharacterized protein n=1 Tax=Sulfitobacter albidus TaxID=2829501 RepID=A0A975JB83_9RHOB|nr:hypothetical protein [Sulfitobacter albidus]QUJ75241.1 hypothetical protein KDD17_09440 [Sulfitobacter albidus]